MPWSSRALQTAATSRRMRMLSASKVRRWSTSMEQFPGATQGRPSLVSIRLTTHVPPATKMTHASTAVGHLGSSDYALTEHQPMPRLTPKQQQQHMHIKGVLDEPRLWVKDDMAKWLYCHAGIRNGKSKIPIGIITKLRHRRPDPLGLYRAFCW